MKSRKVYWRKMQVLGTLTLMLLSVAVLYVTRVGADTAPFTSADVHPDYPGKNEGYFSEIASAQMDNALQAYYMVFGRWPRSWKEVTDSGLFQTKLYSPEMLEIYPDDGRWDFINDIVYEYVERNDTARLNLLGVDKRPTHHVVYRPGSTYKQHFEEGGNAIGMDLSDYLNSQEKLVMMGLISQLRGAAARFHVLYQRDPATWDELVNAGIGPIDRNSRNPLTGGPIKGDGSANNISFRKVKANPQTGQTELIKLELVEPDGSLSSISWN